MLLLVNSLAMISIFFWFDYLHFLHNITSFDVKFINICHKVTFFRKNWQLCRATDAGRSWEEAKITSFAANTYRVNLGEAMGIDWKLW